MSWLIFLLGFFLGIVFWIYATKLLEQKACLNPYRDPLPFKALNGDAEELKILILGDTGSGDDNQQRVADSSAKTCEIQGCDLVLLLGDNFIQKGVEHTEDPQFFSKFEDIYPHQVPFFGILGNHDLKGNWRAQIEYTRKSQRWFMPNVNYVFDAGPVYLQAINTSCTICALWTLFKSSRKPWRVIYGHRPFMTSGCHRGMTWVERQIIRWSKPQFVISGHNHLLEHLHYKGMDQIVSGGGGTPLPKDKKNPSSYTQFIFEDFGYVWMHFTPTQVKTHYYAANGEEIYSFVRNLSCLI